MSLPPRRRMRVVAQHLLWLVLAVLLAHGHAAASPLLAVSPDSIGRFELPANVRVSGFIRIYNRDAQGPMPLTWTISDVLHGTDSDVLWVTESPTSGTIAPADSEDVAVNFNTISVAGGQYLVDLQIDSNDPVHPRVVIPMMLGIVVPVPVRSLTFGHLKARYR